MKNYFFKMALLVVVIATFSACTSVNKTMKEPNTVVKFNKSDFTLSDQVSAEASTVKVLGIDWARLFSKKAGNVVNDFTIPVNIVSIPIIGNFLADRTANYAVYELMSQNPGYDVVIYPQYETKVVKPVLGMGFLTKITTVKTTARLGKLNK